MHQLELSINREIEFMIKYQLTADELFLFKLIFYAQEDHEELLNEFFSQNQLGKPLSELLYSLQEKGIINQSYQVPEKGEIFEPGDVEFNKNVLNSFMKHSQDMGMELFEAYPPYTVINGKTFSLRNIGKSFKSFDDYCWEYGKAIKFNPKKHQEILDLIEWAKDNNQLNNGLDSFVISRQWVTLESVKDGELGIFNTNELI